MKLELLSDYDMMIFEKGKRGGMFHISKRYSEANNKYMKDFNSNKKKTKFIQYLDANNLYGWAMSQRLPTYGFESLNENKISINNVSKI